MIRPWGAFGSSEVGTRVSLFDPRSQAAQEEIAQKQADREAAMQVATDQAASRPQKTFGQYAGKALLLVAVLLAWRMR